jgi:hypothetical protein
VEPVLHESGENKNFYTYDLGEYTLYNGRRENNLKFKIQNKTTNTTEYVYEDSLSDAMILIPKFFVNQDHSIILIMMEVAVEYSWGQEIVLIQNGMVKYLGYLGYAVLGDELEESLSNHCIIEGDKEKMILSFEDVSIIDYSDDDEIINGKTLKFELSIEGINRIY